MTQDSEQVILGNQSVLTRLIDLADNEKLHSCLLFEGPAGVGKHTVAHRLAQAVNCERQQATLLGPAPSSEACGGCWNCRAIAAGTHPDILEIGLDPEKTAPVISVAQSRKLIRDLKLKPFRAAHRVVIIDPAEAMTAEAANALLKTLEEPPDDTILILITSSSSGLLQTVTSRSQRVRFNPVNVDDLALWLDEQGFSNCHWLALMSEGCPGKALSLARGGADEWRSVRDGMVNVLSGSISELFSYGEKMAKGSRSVWTERVDQLLDVLSRMCRDAIVFHAHQERSNGTDGNVRYYNSDRIHLVRFWAEKLGPTGLDTVRGAIDNARMELAGFVNGRLLMDALLLRVATELGPERIGMAEIAEM